MADTGHDGEQPQIYLITPPEFELSRFPDRLASVLDARDIACVRLALASQDEDRIARAADACRAVCHARDVAIVIDSHLRLVERHGLDGVHLSGARGIRDARKDLGEDAIVGSHCGTSRHDGMNAGEAGADYIAFGPVGETALGDGSVAERDLFEWWSQMIELPVVAEGGLTPELVRGLAPITDFFGIGTEIWSQEDAVAALAALMAGAG
ncbi:thiamine phosphate synthase [Tropicimonas marinistellae]|uniref:thiamine phosphate synthase n=1 Tax=Tropicimonas marinistellae TaxID=1739787 RepID=UPI0008370778|nr:thiamine phosphate synthase [Tropicimonas marinistellae]